MIGGFGSSGGHLFVPPQAPASCCGAESTLDSGGDKLRHQHVEVDVFQVVSR